MPKFWEDGLKRFSTWWRACSVNQRVVILLAATAAAGVAGVLAWAVNRPDYAVLYANLDPKEAGAVVESLREEKASYRLGAGGTQVEVAANRVHDLRIKLAGKGIPRGQNAGYELFDKMSFGVTDQVQKINYQRALQSELERTIEALEPIEKARVHLALPTEEIWFEEQQGPTASVLVKLHNGGTLQARQVESIRHLLAASVRALDPERVTIVDTRGRVLSSGEEDGVNGLSEKQIAYKKNIEDLLKGQTESLLNEILGPGKAAVRIYAEIDFNRTLAERESYTPIVGRQGLVRSEKQNQYESALENGGAGGPAGTASNLQGYPPSASNAEKSTKKNERVINYEMNRTIERVTSATGTIRMLSVGIFIDGQYKPAQLADIQAVVSRGLGISAQRGDQIEVKAFPFNRKAFEEERKLLEDSQRQQFWITVATKWVPLGLLLAAAAAFVVMGTRQLQQLSAGQNRPEKENTAHPLSDNGNGQEMEKLLAVLRQNAGPSAQALKQWLS